MRVLIFNSLYYPNIVGGAERSVQILAEGLVRRNITSVVVSTSDKEYVDYVNGVKVYYIKTPNLYWMKETKEQPKWKKPFWHLIDAYNVLTKRKIKKILKAEKPDIIHTNNLAGFSVIVWKIAKELNLPVMHTIRDYYLLCPSSTMFKNGKNCEEQCGLCKLYSFTKKLFSNRYVDGVISKRRVFCLF
ncbi:glycosyltransferase [Hippea alviniae]|uniref:glycosyltransferase n=1 Tax=Hippea alviniae TaxID=1279027 RepID=UPI0003B34E18|nr:glycosyltransferase [Hippea alviniae]